MKLWKIILNSNIQNENSYYLLKTIKAHLLDVWKSLFIEERNQIVSCGSDSLIKVWDISLVKTCKNDNNQNIDIKNYSNNNSNSNKEIKNIINVELNKEIKAHKYWILTMIQAKNNKKNVNYLISNSGDSTIKFFDINQNYNLIHSINNNICCKPGAMANYNEEKFLIGGPRGIFFYIINFLNFQI
jgi:WD40 repeat protein